MVSQRVRRCRKPHRPVIWLIGGLLVTVVAYLGQAVPQAGATADSAVARSAGARTPLMSCADLSTLSLPGSYLCRNKIQLTNPWIVGRSGAG